MRTVELHLCGTGIPHTPDFVIDRPCDPHGTILIFSFLSPGVILTEDGLETAGAGDCIIHRKDFYQYHAAVPGTAEGYKNDFLHVDPKFVEPIAEHLELPFNRLIHTGRPDILTPFIREIESELLTGDSFSEALVKNIVEHMLLDLARARKNIDEQRPYLTVRERRYFQQFCDVRSLLRKNFQKNFSLKELAEEVHLSPERFAVLYRKFFHCSPYQERIGVRIIHAKRLLIISDMEIKEIATLCGWDDFHYFSRIFKEKCGIPPSQFREQAQKNYGRPI